MSTDYFVDGELQLSFFCGPNSQPLVQINQPRGKSFITLPLELFYHLLTDPELFHDTVQRYNSLCKRGK